MTLLEEIASWDGKSATALQSTHERHSDDEDFLATILEHIADVELQRAATWLLKRHLEAGNSLSPGGFSGDSGRGSLSRSTGRAGSIFSNAFLISILTEDQRADLERVSGLLPRKPQQVPPGVGL